MKIIRLTTLLNFGGQEKQYLSFSEDKNSLKYHYIFAAIGYGGHAEELLKERGFEVHVFNQNPAIQNLRNIIILYRFIKKVKPDVVHTAAAEANFHGIIAAKLAGVKIVIGEEIGLPNHSWLAKKIFKLVYYLTQKVICVSQSVKDYLILINEIDEKKGLVLYNPVSVPCKIEKKQLDCLVLTYVGRLEVVKNVKILIEAFSKLSNFKNIKLIIVGDGCERDNLEQLSNDLGVGSNIEFKGFIPNPEIYISQSDLFILPSLSEGFGIAVVEAMFQGIPCLCSNVGGIPEFIIHGETGWLFAPNNINELVHILEEILKSPQKMEQVGKKGKAYALSRFSNFTYIESIELVYNRLFFNE